MFFQARSSWLVLTWHCRLQIVSPFLVFVSSFYFLAFYFLALFGRAGISLQYSLSPSVSSSKYSFGICLGDVCLTTHLKSINNTVLNVIVILFTFSLAPLGTQNKSLKNLQTAKLVINLEWFCTNNDIIYKFPRRLNNVWVWLNVTTF